MAGRGNEKPPIPTAQNPVKGQVERTNHYLRKGVVGYWKWNGKSWDVVEKEDYTQYQKEGITNREIPKELVISAGPLDGKTPDNDTYRWPADQIQEETDYVFFQFGKYIPPFSKQAGDNLGSFRKGEATKRQGYEAGTALLKPDPAYASIMLPVPQDLSNTTAAGWQGKAFTGMGRAAVAAAAGGSLNFARQKAGDFTGNVKAIQDSLTNSVLNLIPGVGGALDVNDISGSARGVVLNPNAELLYDSPELREIGMTFKMVPRNAEEAQTIRAICRTFRRAMLPVWGAEEDISFNRVSYEKGSGDKDLGATAKGKKEGTAKISGENFIRVPHMCKFTFMKGNKPHGWLTQFKPCAISNVVVNYTPDNTYATYSDGSPVATEIRLNFQESKLIFADEVEKGF